MPTDGEGPAGRTGPTNVVVVLLDSLNRHMLGSYGGTEFATPNLDRFAAGRATRFTRHVTGSLPCIPARHDILCGALDFLWRPWGSVEVWERPITADLRAAGVTTMLVSDHPHLFETGGENYHTDFSGWDYVRGHEGDPWRTHVDTSWVGTPAPPARDGGWFWRRTAGDDVVVDRAYDRSRTYFRAEADYPGPRTMTAAADWIRRVAPHHDRWLLFVDEFDPHEPFDVPAPWLGRYDDGPWDGDRIIWPPYVVGGVSRGVLDPAEARHIRAAYGAKLSMIDHWFGEVVSALDEGGRWDDTAVVVCTDHGHYLGDVRGGRDIWGKPGVPQYEPLGHMPLLVRWPGVEGGGVCDALTTSVDLHATLADVFGVAPAHRTHGVSLRPLLDSRPPSPGTGRELAIGGVWGNWVQVTDGRRKYARAPVEGNRPLAVWSNRWSTMPLHMAGVVEMPPPDARAGLAFMPGSTVPVIRQPYGPGDPLPFWALTRRGRHHLYDVDVDPDEAENRADEPRAAKEMINLLHAALESVEAPPEQYERLGLA